jgi:hypothetical protein
LIFENAAVYPVISLLSKKVSNEEYFEAILPEKHNPNRFYINDYSNNLISYNLLSKLPEYIWGFVLSRNSKLLEPLLKNTTALSNICEVNATTTAGEADEFSEFICNKNTNYSKKIINTGTIDPYTSLWGLSEMTNKGKKYLTPYIDTKKSRMALRRIKMYSLPKIIFAKMAKNVEAFLDIDGEFASINTNCLYNPIDGVSLKYICSIVNSKLFMFIYDLFFGTLRMSGGYYQFQAPQLRVMPVLVVENEKQEMLVKIVDRILFKKSSNPQADTSALERQIDNLVYRLYNLTYDEVKVIEPNFPLTKAMYEGIEVGQYE